MPKDIFKYRKWNQLKKDDKSFKGSWDEKIRKLCDKINSFEEYYTTSSCSGRAFLLKDFKEKRDNLFVKVWHNEINFGDLKKALLELKSKEVIYFKQTPVILHVSCRTLEDAQKLLDLAVKEAGWKRCSILFSVIPPQLAAGIKL